jgi:acetyl esterase/lipase
MEYPQDHIVNQSGPIGERVIAYGEDPDQIIEMYGEGEKPPLLILLHGGYWRPTIDRTHLQPLAKMLAEQKFRVALLEYRRVQGKPYDYQDDIFAAIKKLGSKNSIVIGHSAGGHLALLAARKFSDLKGVISISPVADLGLGEKENLGDGAINLFLGGRVDDFADLDPIRLSPAQVKVHVIHSSGDFIPELVAKNYVEKQKSAGEDVAYTLVPEADHFTLVDPRTFGFEILLKTINTFG